MKAIIIKCDVCGKLMDESTSTYITLLTTRNGIVTEKVDVCLDCIHTTVDTFCAPADEGGVQE